MGRARSGPPPGGARRRAALGCVVGALLVAAAPGAARGQVFLAARPGPEFTIGPLFVQASVTEGLGPVTVDVLWSLVVPAGRTARDLEQDLFLLWPSAVLGRADLGKPDAALARFVEPRGFTVVDEGRLPLFAQSLYQTSGDVPAEPVPGGAPFVTVVRRSGPLGLTPPVTYVRIPWTPRLVNRTWQMDLRLTIDGLLRPKKASWVERMFQGPRHVVAVAFNDVRQPAMFPLYFEHRSHVVRLSDDPSQLIVNFASADRLKIDSVSPASSTRQLSQSLENTEVVSAYLDPSEGLTPQTLTVQFGYFKGLQAWTPVLIPFLFFVLGNAAGPAVGHLVRRLAGSLASRLDLARKEDDPRRQTGVVLARDVIGRLVPGETTYDQVLRLCGPAVEEHERIDGAGGRTLVYRGRRVVPRRRRRLGWLATVSRWDVEDHEVRVEMEGDVVKDVHAGVRRSRLARRGDTG